MYEGRANIEPRLTSVVELIAVATAFGMRMASPETASLSFLFLAAYALFGRAQAIRALGLAWLFTMLNPGLAPEATMTSAARYAVLLGAAISVFLRSLLPEMRIRIRSVTFATIMLGLFFVIHSLFFSTIAGVSVLKAASWMLVASTLIAAWAGLAAEERDALARQVFGGLVVLMIVSLPLLVMPQGYLRNGMGFQGVLNHPQAFGPAMALLGAWAASQILGQRKPRWLDVALLGGCFVMVLLSEARTAGLALILGVGVAVILTPGLSGHSVRAVLPGLRSTRVRLLAMMALLGVVLAGAQLESVMTHYIAKSGRAETSSLIAAYEKSRGGLIGRMWANIQDKPFQGIGFGIASDPATMKIQRDPVMGLPTGAPIEKGVLPLAVLEEVGLIGFSAVTAWVLMLLRRSSGGGVAPAAVGLTALLLNMGEATLFSPGGMGLLSLVLIAWAFACGQEQGRTQTTRQVS
jgi:hypothetical protein